MQKKPNAHYRAAAGIIVAVLSVGSVVGMGCKRDEDMRTSGGNNAGSVPNGHSGASSGGGTGTSGTGASGSAMPGGVTTSPATHPGAGGAP